MATMASLLLMASVPHPPPLRNGFLLATRQYVISAFPNSTEKKFSNRKAVIVSAQSSDSSWEREEARWLREEKRWLREEERWLKEEARWNAQRQALEDEIESLRGHIRVLQEQSQTSMIKEEASLSDLITSLTRFLQSLDGVDASVTRISSNPQVQISSSASSLNDFDSLLKRGSSGEPSGESLSFDGKPTERPQNKVGRNVSVGVDLKDGINAKQTVKSTPTAEKKKKRNLRRGSEGEDVKEMQEALERLGFYSGEEDMEYSSFSGGTESAVKSWQATIGVVEDGKMTAELLAILLSEQTKMGIDLDEEVTDTASVVSARKEGMNGTVQTPVLTVKEVAEIEQTIRTEPKGVEISERRVFLLGENRWEEPQRLVDSNRQQGGTKTLTPAKCFSCRGEGKFLCSECDGTGDLNVEEQFLEWVEEGAKCPYCEGSGFVVCDLCEGKPAKF